MVTQPKPKCKLTETDDNIFALSFKAGKALKEAGQIDKVPEMNERIFSSNSYQQALDTIQEYVEVENESSP